MADGGIEPYEPENHVVALYGTGTLKFHLWRSRASGYWKEATNPDFSVMSGVQIDISGTLTSRKDLCSADAPSMSIGPSQHHDEFRAPLSSSFSNNWASMSSNQVNSISTSTPQDLPLRSSSEDTEELLSPSPGDGYTHERVSDPLGRLHQNVNYPDLLDEYHSTKHEYAKRDLQSHVPRYMPKLPEMLRNPYILSTEPELSSEISKSGQSLGHQYAESSSGHELTVIHGEDALKNSTVIKLEQNSHEQKDGEPTLQKSESATSLSSAVNAVVLVQRCIKNWSPARIPLSFPALVAIGRRDIQDHRHGQSLSEDIEPYALLSVSEQASDITETNSVDSFEDESNDSSCDGGKSDFEDSFLRLQIGQSKDALSAFLSTLNQYPDDVASYLANQISSSFDAWLRCLAVVQHTGRQSSSSNARRQAPKTPRTSFLAGSGKRRSNIAGKDDSSSPGDGSSGNGKKSGASSEVSMKRWACPFYRKDPRYYCMERDFGDYRSCSKRHGFKEVHRVKSHLIQHHTAIYCGRCYSQFKTDLDLETHYQFDLRCEARPRPLLEGLNKDQRKLLKTRDRNNSEEGRWRTIYRICFPNDNNHIPSPYYVPPETPLYRQEVLSIVRESLSTDYPEREAFLQRLEDALNTSDGTSESILSPVLPLLSPSSISHPSEPISENTPPQWQPMQIPHQDPRDVEENQDDRFMPDEISTGAMGMEGGALYSTSNSPYFVSGMSYDSGYTGGSIRRVS